MEKAFEVDFINKIAGNFKRSPMQKNKIHEADAEIISLPGINKKKLAITTDTISEEIKFGLYDDPFLIGWMTVMANMSDLAAVGAAPIGILISEAFTNQLKQEYLFEIQKGIEAACRLCNTYVLGGDITAADRLSLTGCAVGILNGQKFLGRVGCNPGDLIYSTSKLGKGNGFALQKFNQLKPLVEYKPTARLIEGKSLIGIANSCMDTSDGAISTLDQIMRLNNCGIELEKDWENFIDEESKSVCEKLDLPLWFLLAGYHGEFELIFSIAPDCESKLLSMAKKNKWNPIKIGQAIESQKLILNLYGKKREIDSSFIRNLAFQHSSNIKSYIKLLFEYDGVLRTN